MLLLRNEFFRGIWLIVEIGVSRKRQHVEEKMSYQIGRDGGCKKARGFSFLY
jgi:hypothetical protein